MKLSRRVLMLKEKSKIWVKRTQVLNLNLICFLFVIRILLMLERYPVGQLVVVVSTMADVLSSPSFHWTTRQQEPSDSKIFFSGVDVVRRCPIRSLVVHIIIFLLGFLVCLVSLLVRSISSAFLPQLTKIPYLGRYTRQRYPGGWRCARTGNSTENRKARRNINSSIG